MSVDMPAKLQNLLWWITSIAVSVLCCSVLFVLFASYLVEVKSSVQNSNDRITAIEERENQILNELEMMRKHPVPASGQPAAAAPQPEAAPAESAAPVDAGPAITPPTMPAPAAAPDKK